MIRQHCPENLLLWFHHLPWDHRMNSGRTLWDEMCHRYNDGVLQAEGYKAYWETLDGKIDDEQYRHVLQLLNIQVRGSTLVERCLPGSISRPSRADLSRPGWKSRNIILNITGD